MISLAGFAYVILTLGFPCSTATSKLVIDLEDSYVRTGTNLNITCTCSSDCAVKDIFWKRYSKVVSENISVVNDSTSQLSLYDLQFDDTAQYSCCLKDGSPSKCSVPVYVRVGMPPGPVKNFNCMSRNMMDFWCEWDEGESTNFRMTYVFQYKSHYNETWIDCPDKETKGDNSCYVTDTTSLQNVRVNSSNILGFYTDTSSFNPDIMTIPNPPRDVTLQNITPNNLEVSWKVPDEWNEEYYKNFLHYKIRYNSNSTEWLEAVTDRFSTDKTLTELRPFTKYEVQVATQVYSYDEGFWSDWSEKVSKTTNEAAPIGVVTSPGYDEYLTQPSKRDVNLHWEELPMDQRNGIIRGYILYVTNDTDSTTNKHDVHTNKKSLSGLERYSKYTVVLQAYNNAGSGPNMTFCCIQDKTDAPGVPTEIHGEPISNSSISLTWEAPIQPNGVMHHYDILWRDNSLDDTWPFNGTIRADSNPLQYELKGLQVYTSYYIKIRAINHKFNGQWEELVDPIRTKEGAPSKAPEPVLIEEVAGNGDQLSVSWTPLSDEDKNGIIRGYRVLYCLSHRVPDCEGDITVRQELSSVTVIYNLQSYTTYLIWVAAYTDAGQGPFSAKQLNRTGQGIPSAPQNVRITEITSSNVSLEWNAPAHPNGIISKYKITYFKEPDFALADGSVEVDTLYADVDKLWGNVRYLFKVLGCNAAHCGDFNQTWVITKIGAPAPPALQNIAPESDTKMSLSWNPSVPPNGPIDSYYVEHRQSTSNGQWVKKKVPSKITNTTVTVDCGLGDDGVMFDFRVYATTADGEVLPGLPSEVRQFEMCSPIPASELIQSIVIPLCVVVIATLVCILVYRIRKDTIPDPLIFKDETMDKYWEVTFRVREKEIFDDPMPLLCTHPTSLSNSKMEVADDFDGTQWDTANMGNHLARCNLVDSNGTGVSRTESIDSGLPSTPLFDNDNLSPFPSPRDNNAFEDEQNNNDTTIIDIHSLFAPSNIGLFETHSPRSKGELTRNQNSRSQGVKNHICPIPLNVLNNTDSAYSKMSQIPSSSDHSSKQKGAMHSEDNIHMSDILSKQRSLQIPRSPDYSRMSQIQSNRNITPVVSRHQSAFKLSPSSAASDYSRMSEIPKASEGTTQTISTHKSILRYPTSANSGRPRISQTQASETTMKKPSNFNYSRMSEIHIPEEVIPNLPIHPSASIHPQSAKSEYSKMSDIRDNENSAATTSNKEINTMHPPSCYSKMSEIQVPKSATPNISFQPSPLLPRSPTLSHDSGMSAISVPVGAVPTTSADLGYSRMSQFQGSGNSMPTPNQQSVSSLPHTSVNLDYSRMSEITKSLNQQIPSRRPHSGNLDCSMIPDSREIPTLNASANQGIASMPSRSSAAPGYSRRPDIHLHESAMPTGSSSLLPHSSANSGYSRMSEVNPQENSISNTLNQESPLMLPQSSAKSGYSRISEVQAQESTLPNTSNQKSPSMLPQFSAKSDYSRISEVQAQENAIPNTSHQKSPSMVPQSSTKSGYSRMSDVQAQENALSNNSNQKSPSMLPQSSAKSGYSRLSEVQPQENAKSITSNEMCPSMVPQSSATSGYSRMSEVQAQENAKLITSNQKSPSIVPQSSATSGYSRMSEVKAQENSISNTSNQKSPSMLPQSSAKSGYSRMSEVQAKANAKSNTSNQKSPSMLPQSSATSVYSKMSDIQVHDNALPATSNQKSASMPSAPGYSSLSDIQAHENTIPTISNQGSTPMVPHSSANSGYSRTPETKFQENVVLTNSNQESAARLENSSYSKTSEMQVPESAMQTILSQQGASKRSHLSGTGSSGYVKLSDIQAPSIALPTSINQQNSSMSPHFSINSPLYSSTNTNTSIQDSTRSKLNSNVPQLGKQPELPSQPSPTSPQSNPYTSTQEPKLECQQNAAEFKTESNKPAAVGASASNPYSRIGEVSHDSTTRTSNTTVSRNSQQDHCAISDPSQISPVINEHVMANFLGSQTNSHSPSPSRAATANTESARKQYNDSPYVQW